MAQMRTVVRKAKVKMVAEALAGSAGHVQTAAQRLGISRIWLHDLIRQNPSLRRAQERARKGQPATRRRRRAASETSS